MYENYRLIDLRCDSLAVWILSLILIDFGFYWFHRACHGKWNLISPPSPSPSPSPLLLDSLFHSRHTRCYSLRIKATSSRVGFSIAWTPFNLSGAICLPPSENYRRPINCLCHLRWLTHLTFYYSFALSPEVNFLWATHQVHHSSQHFNLSTALRQSVPQLYLHTVSNITTSERWNILFFRPNVSFNFAHGGHLVCWLATIWARYFLPAPLAAQVSRRLVKLFRLFAMIHMFHNHQRKQWLTWPGYPSPCGLEISLINVKYFPLLPTVVLFTLGCFHSTVAVPDSFWAEYPLSILDSYWDPWLLWDFRLHH